MLVKRNNMRTIGIVLLLSYYHHIYSQNNFQFTFSKSSIGFIICNDKTIGTGFVAGRSDWVITCEHVDRINPGSKSFQQVSTGRNFPIKLYKYSRIYDIAIFQADEIISDSIFNLDTTYQINTKSTVIYAGYDSRKSKGDTRTISINKAIIEAAGYLDLGELSTQFVEFIGEGFPGYSGGPVFNTNGDVIALMAQAYIRRGLNESSQPQVVNRAFVIWPISMLLSN